MLRIDEAKKLLRDMFLEKINGYRVPNVMLLGAPGIGKTEIVRQVAEEVAREIGYEFVEYDEANIDVVKRLLSGEKKAVVYVYMNLNEIDAADVTGVPRVDFDTDTVRFKPLLWAKVCSKQVCIVHLDEITSVINDSVKSAAMKIICEMKVGYVSLSTGTLVVATGNNPEENSMAQLLPAPFVNKVVELQVTAPDLKKWSQYMDKRFKGEWDKRVLAYLSQYPGDFLVVPKEGETLKPYATPRSWTNLAVLLHRIGKKVTGKMLTDIIAGLVGGEIATRFKTFIDTKIDPYKILGNDRAYRNLSMSGKYIFAIWLGEHVNKNPKRNIKDLLWLYKVDPERGTVAVTVLNRKALTILVGELARNSKHEKIVDTLLDIAQRRAELLRG